MKVNPRDRQVGILLARRKLLGQQNPKTRLVAQDWPEQSYRSVPPGVWGKGSDLLRLCFRVLGIVGLRDWRNWPIAAIVAPDARQSSKWRGESNRIRSVSAYRDDDRKSIGFCDLNDAAVDENASLSSYCIHSTHWVERFSPSTIPRNVTSHT